MPFELCLDPISPISDYFKRLNNRNFGSNPLNERNSSHLDLYSASNERNSTSIDFQLGSKDPTKVLSEEIILHIFSHLDMSSLGASRQVSKKWNQIAQDESLWKSVIYREIAFSNKDWAKCLGAEVVANEDCREELASLPWQEYIEDSRQFHKLFPGKSGKEHLMLVRLPKTLTAIRNKNDELVGGLTLNSLGRLAKQYFPQDGQTHWYMMVEIFNELGDCTIDQSRWVLMTKDVIEGSRNQNYSKQQEIVADLANKSLPGYEVPGTLEAATCIFSQYLSNSETYFSSDKPFSIRCKENVEGYQTLIGHSPYGGLFLNRNFCDFDHIGIVAQRKF